ncbi:MAG: hypothetical protein KKF56_01880 [Nanoarchaeota archaeon]|nr:hypothetical protein [Nanoarchaeota archaeon]
MKKRSGLIGVGLSLVLAAVGGGCGGSSSYDSSSDRRSVSLDISSKNHYFELGRISLESAKTSGEYDKRSLFRQAARNFAKAGATREVQGMYDRFLQEKEVELAGDVWDIAKREKVMIEAPASQPIDFENLTTR